MAWEFKDQRPIYIQLIEQIKLKIISGEFKPGQKFPTVRELAE
ncbi:MAG: GntR family transcriptional regulator, partial [Clostridium sp.]|nr:GntR family transcriptional regulator [Clostridium sp.]